MKLPCSYDGSQACRSTASGQSDKTGPNVLQNIYPYGVRKALILGTYGRSWSVADVNSLGLSVYIQSLGTRDSGNLTTPTRNYITLTQQQSAFDDPVSKCIRRDYSSHERLSLSSNPLALAVPCQPRIAPTRSVPSSLLFIQLTNTRQDAIDALNSLQAPYHVLEYRRRAGIRPDESSVREMKGYLRRIGYTVCLTQCGLPLVEANE